MGGRWLGHLCGRRLTTGVMVVAILLLWWSAPTVAAIHPHPRLWLAPAVLSDLKEKQSRNDAPVDGAKLLALVAPSGRFLAAAGAARTAATALMPQASGRNLCRNGQFVMNADVHLRGRDSIELVGTPEQPCRVMGNQHRFVVDGDRWSGDFKMRYAEVNEVGTASLELLGGAVAGNYATLNGGSIDIQHTIFRRSGGFNLYTAGRATIIFNYNEYADDNAVPAGGPSAEFAVWFTEQGSADTRKYFQGNTIRRAYARFLGPGWVIGREPKCKADCEGQSNVFIGRRVGFEVGPGSYAAYNYVHTDLDVSPDTDYWSQVSSVGAIASGAIVEHNIFRAAHWVAIAVHGELRFNVLAEAHGHDFVRLGSGGTVHHNILFGKYQGMDRYSTGQPFAVLPAIFGLFQAGNSLSFYNNTIDARSAATLLWVNDGAMVRSFRNNVAYGIQLTTAGCPAEPSCTSAVGLSDQEGFAAVAPPRALYLDYNDFFYDSNTSRRRTYAIAVAGKRLCDPGWGGHDLGTCPNGGVDPEFRGPLPIASLRSPLGEASGFPFNDGEILDRTYSVSEMLMYFRWVYAPRSGSPLIGAQDPQDGPGDIGAVQVRDLPETAPAIVTTNKRPMVHAGGSFAVDSLVARLSGYAADDGLPSKVLSVRWTKVSGPGDVRFDEETEGITNAQFTVPGTYVLRLTASDGALDSHADARISVGRAPTTTPSSIR